MIIKLFRHFLLFLCFICCIATFKTFSAIPHRQAKGLFTAVNPAKWYLSPLQGLTWYKRIVRNMYEFGHDDHATIKLVRDLFYIQNENFDISRGPVNPASYLEVADIGKILNAIETVASDKLQAELVTIISKACAKAPQKIAEKKIKDLAKHIVGSLKECPVDNTGMYLGYTMHNILLAYLWQKVTDKKQYFEYFAQFDVKMNVLTDPTKITADEYTADEIGAFNAAVDADPKKLLENYELAVVLGCDGLVRTGDCPPNLGFSKAIFTENAKTSEPFSDCGETALWNLFNWLLYNKEHGTFDVSLLNHIPALDKKFVEFFQDYSSVQKLDDIKTRNAWAAVVSGRDDVVYRNTSPRCNISGEKGLSNALAVLNHLLFGNSKDFAAKTKQEQLNYVCEKLSENGLKVAWEVKNGKPEDVNTKDHLTLLLTIIKNNITLKAEWRFSSNHFVFSFNNDESKKNILNDFLILTCKNNENLRTSMLQLFPWFYLLRGHDEPGGYGEYADLIQNNKHQSIMAIASFGMFMTPIRTEENKLTIISFYFKKLVKEILKGIGSFDSRFNTIKVLEPSIIKVLKTLPDDAFSFEHVGACLIQYTEKDDIDFVKRLVCDTQISDWLRVNVIDRLTHPFPFNNGRSEEARYKKWFSVMQDVFNNLHHDDQILKTIEILSKRIDPAKFLFCVDAIKLLIARLQNDISKAKAINLLWAWGVCEQWVSSYGEDSLVKVLDSITEFKALTEINYKRAAKNSKKIDAKLRAKIKMVKQDDDKISLIKAIAGHHSDNFAVNYLDVVVDLINTMDIKKATTILHELITTKIHYSTNKSVQKNAESDKYMQEIMKWTDLQIKSIDDTSRISLMKSLDELAQSVRSRMKDYLPEVYSEMFKVLTAIQEVQNKNEITERLKSAICDAYPENWTAELPIREQLLKQLEQA